MQTLATAKTVHIVGIKGVGVTALAQILHSRGCTVTGSDVDEEFFTDTVLADFGITVHSGFTVDHVSESVDMVVYSTAYDPEKNPELVAANERGIPLLSYPEALGQLMEDRQGICVCGSHGKTTTTALLATIVAAGGLKPSAIVGSTVKSWNGNALVGNGEYFIAEADEYQNKLQYLSPEIVVLTNADYDHPDFFPTVESYMQVFRDFVKRIPATGLLVVCGDSKSALEISESAQCSIVTYGFREHNMVRLTTESISEHHQTIALTYKKLTETFPLSLFGEHNALNACAAIIVARHVGVEDDISKKILKIFEGAARRFERKGEYNGAQLIDDYAHHPAEIVATLKSARERFPEKRIIALFHPHTFSRTKALLDQFSESFSDADEVILLDIYGSAREDAGDVTSDQIVDQINVYGGIKAHKAVSKEVAAGYLAKKIDKNDVVITLGAGDVWKVLEMLKRM